MLTREGSVVFIHAVLSCGLVGAIGCSGAVYSEGSGPPPDDPIEWIEIAGGSFLMGSEHGADDELPVHEVTVPAFEILKSEVTIGQYQECVEASVCDGPTAELKYWPGGGPSDENSPVVNVSWLEAAEFCEWQGGRLPTESEWEYAARSEGKENTFPWGEDEPTWAHAVFDDCNWFFGCFPSDAWEVCSKPLGVTEQGLCDMAGSVDEWVADCYHDSYETEHSGAHPTNGAAWTTECAEPSVARGGSWVGVDSHLRTSGRLSIRGGAYADVGFRCVREE